MLAFHRAIGTYSRDIDRYIVLTAFARQKTLKGGIEQQKVTVKPNFLPNPPVPGCGKGGYVVYVGRLLEGKGTETLVTAWRHLPTVTLKIVGDGALRPKLEAIVRRENLNVEFAGLQDRDAVLDVLRRAELLVIPSEWYEGFPLVVAESYACGTPVLASRIGSLDELVQEGVTGAKFPVGNAVALAASVRRLFADQAGLRRMRTAARAYFDAHLTEEQNYMQLKRIYSEVMARNDSRNLRSASDERRTE